MSQANHHSNACIMTLHIS